MPVYIQCDLPGCEAATPAVMRAGKLGYPSGWCIATGEEKILVACCAEHSWQIQRLTPPVPPVPNISK